MSNLGPQQQNQTFDGLLQVPGGVTAQLQTVQDGDGNNTPLKVGSQNVQIGDVVDTSILQIPGGVTTSLQTVLDGNGNPTGLQLSSSGASVTTSDTFVASENGTQITGVVPRLISDGFGDYLSILDFGAVGDGVTDDTTAFQNAINYCQANNRNLYIPKTSSFYVLSGTLTISFPMSIKSDPLAGMHWTSLPSSSTPGILIDYGNVPYNLGKYELPVLQGPTQDVTALQGVAVRVANGDIIDLYIHYAIGWSVGVHYYAQVSSMYNNKLTFNVFDRCNIGLLLEALGSYYISESEFHGTTIGICQYGVYCKSNTGYIEANKFYFQSIWVEYTGGSSLYGYGSNIFFNDFTVGKAVNTNTANTPPAQGSFNGPFVLGNSSSAQDSGGYFGGANNNFYINQEGPAPSAGQQIRYKAYGESNYVSSKNNILRGNPIAPSSVQGEANFLGGVGSAIMAQDLNCNISVPAGTAGSTLTYYVYHQCLTGYTSKPITITPYNSYGHLIFVSATDNSFAVDREIVITVRYISTTVTSTGVSFTLKIQ